MNPFDIDDDDKVEQFTVDLDPVHQSADTECDPLDAFMDDLDKKEHDQPLKKHYFHETEIEEEETPEEMMDRIVSSRSHADPLADSSELPKRSIENLELFDHSTVTYLPFQRDLYREHESISVLSESAIASLRTDLGVSVTGSSIPKCVCSFGHFNLPSTVIQVIQLMNYSIPTPIQSQTIPCALSGRDVLAIAPTGSGKTMAYLLPAIVHVLENPEASVLILCPTRELAIQIEQEIYKFSRKCGFTSLALTGGLSKYEQFKTLKDDSLRFIVGNPGRVLDLVQMKNGLSFFHTTFCVLDEADRMFHMGFENQVRQIIQRVRPDRQMLMFSATMPPRIEKMAREVLVNPVRIIIGSLGQAAFEIKQNVFIAHSGDERLVWLLHFLKPVDANVNPMSIEKAKIHVGEKFERIMIFVNSKQSADLLAESLRKNRHSANVIHGDIDQSGRMRIMNEFKSGATPILVATDVAARGLDVANVSCVIEFEAARDVDTHTHRIGRTGRAGQEGTSWTLLMRNENKLAAHIAESIENTGRHVPDDLMELAKTFPPFAQDRSEPKRQKLNEEESWEPLDKHFIKGKTE